MAEVLTNALLNDGGFWNGKQALLPGYDRTATAVRSIAFSAGRMAFGHTGDILQDILNDDPSAGMMAGVETYAAPYVTELDASDTLVTQLIYENEKGVVVPKIQGAIGRVFFCDGNPGGLGWQRVVALARDPEVQFATINAPEGVYGVAWHGGEFADIVSPVLKQDCEEGTIKSDPAKWTAFALERFKAGLPFALVSCTNFSGNGHYTAATVKAVAQAWERKGHAPQGFVAYLSDPERFGFPNCMIDRIAVPADTSAHAVMDNLGIASVIVVTEKVRYWAVEDRFPAGRPAFEKADGVFMVPTYEEVKKYEDMKLRILNMSHSLIAGLGVLLGYRGEYGIFRAMQDADLPKLIDRIIDIVIQTIDAPENLDPRVFARDTIERLNNPNIPDDPMRIAFNNSAKMLPRFMDTWFAAVTKGIAVDDLDVVLLPVAGFLRYTLGIDDAGATYDLADDPIRETLVACGKEAALGDPSTSTAFEKLIADTTVMGEDLYTQGDAGARMEKMVAAMLEGEGAVRKAVAAAVA